MTSVAPRTLHTADHEPQTAPADPELRLDKLFEERCEQIRECDPAKQLAVVADGASLTYDELDRRANQLARYLRLRGARSGDHIALLFDKPVGAIVGMLAILKINAVYLSLDADGPVEWASAIVADAGARLVLTHSHLRERAALITSLADGGVDPVIVDDAARLIGQLNPGRLLTVEQHEEPDQPACILYPAEPGDRPRGIALGHSSLCAAVRLARQVYGVRAADRIYHGHEAVTGFAVENVWLALTAGATLIPEPTALRGQPLHRFLWEQRVTAMYCSPALLAGIEHDLPDMRFLLVAGEPCPQELTTRWTKPGRRLFTAAVPAEAIGTVDRAVPWSPTGDMPLPTDATVTLDLDRASLPLIGSVAVDDATVDRSAAVTAPSAVRSTPPVNDQLNAALSELARVRAEIDVLKSDLRRLQPGSRQDPAPRPTPGPRPAARRQPAPAPRPFTPPQPPLRPRPTPRPRPAQQPTSAQPHTPNPATPNARLAQQQTSARSHTPNPSTPGSRPAPPARAAARPPWPSDPVRAPRPSPAPALLRPSAPAPVPVPTPASRPTASQPGDAAASLEAALASALAEALRVDQVSVDGHFFDDLGADSMVMAQFCARLRKQADLPNVSIKDVYQHSTIRGLAGALASSSVAPAKAKQPASAAPEQIGLRTMPQIPAPRPMDVRQPSPPPAGVLVPTSRSKPRFFLCGLLQLLMFLGTSYATALTAVSGLGWIFSSPTLLDTYVRSAIFGSGTFVVLCLLPILLKWTLVGRWKPRQIPVWSLAYLRFWIVKSAIRTNPMARFAGTPLYVLYLRTLGAKIGRGVTILSTTVPVCTDLLTIGAGSIIRKDSTFTCYRAHDGLIQTGPVTLGENVYVGEATVLDIACAMGPGAQLGHSSSLHTGQIMPAGERWHGSPAERTQVDYRRVPSGGRDGVRRVMVSLLQLAILLGVVLPLAFGTMDVLLERIPQLAAVSNVALPGLTTWPFYRDALVIGSAFYFGSLLFGLLVVFTVPRVLDCFLTQGKAYRLYGFAYLVHRAIGRVTNRKLFTRLFGDSSFIVHYLRGIGYDLFRVEQTGSNFGTDVKQDNPFLSSVGSGTVIADGLSIINADYSNTHFRVSRVRIGAYNFLGNRIAYPAGGRTGDNCLLATKVMVPLDGPVRQGVGLLGSPSFEIPRTVARDNKLDVKSPQELRRLLSAKNRHNATTILLFLLTRWLLSAALMVVALGTLNLYTTFGAPVAALIGVLVLPLTVGYYLLLDRAVRGLRAHRPDGCSIYDRAFWRHERFWKICADAYLQIFNGTPFKNLIWRMLGVRIGRRVFDDGCFITERAFTTIGDRCTLNAGSVIQCHSQEDGAFKSDRTSLGAGVTLGVNAFVHYGVTISEGAALEPDSFLMKGEEVPPFARWGGNPAMEIDESSFGIHPNIGNHSVATTYAA